MFFSPDFILIILFLYLNVYKSLNRTFLSVLLLFVYAILNIFGSNYYLDSIYIYILNLLINLNFNIILIFIITYYLLGNTSKPINAYILPLVYFYALEHSNLLSFVNTNLLDNLNYSLNLNLINGLFIIHPILIYIYYSINLLVITLVIYYYGISTNYSINRFNYAQLRIALISLVKNYLAVSLKIIIIAIILGSWWAFQELSWGAWWNWDLVEVINLYYLVFSINLIHGSFLKNLYSFISYYKTYVFNIIILMLVVRYNLVQSIHSFISVNSYRQYTYIVFIYILYKIKVLLGAAYVNYFNRITYKVDLITMIYIILFSIIILNLFLNILNISIIQLIQLIKPMSIILLYLSLNYISINMLKTSLSKINIILIICSIFNDFIIISNIYLILWSINVFRLKHIIYLVYLYIIISLNTDLKLNINIYNYMPLVDLNFYLNDSSFIVNQFYSNEVWHLYNYINSNTLFNQTAIKNSFTYNDYNTQLSLATNYISTWIDCSNNNKYIYLYSYLSNTILYLYIYTIRAFTYTYIRKIN